MTSDDQDRSRQSVRGDERNLRGLAVRHVRLSRSVVPIAPSHSALRSQFVTSNMHGPPPGTRVTTKCTYIGGIVQCANGTIHTGPEESPQDRTARFLTGHSIIFAHADIWHMAREGWICLAAPSVSDYAPTLAKSRSCRTCAACHAPPRCGVSPRNASSSPILRRL